jgi:hypothetical protein
MQRSRRLEGTVIRLLVAFSVLGGAACAARGPEANPPNAAPSPQATITICGRVESATRLEDAAGVSTRLTLRDARSSSRFTVTISPAVRPAFETALGAAPEIAYDGRSICATGNLREEAGEPRLDLAKPEDVTINAAVR